MTRRHRHRSTFRRKLGGIRQQVAQNLHQPFGIGLDGDCRQWTAQFVSHLETFRINAVKFDCMMQEIPQRNRLQIEGHRTG